MRTRRRRHDLRSALRTVHNVKRLSRCGFALGASVDVKWSAGHGVGVAGTETCGSWWACPVCSQKIAARRTTELESVLDHATRLGKSLAMLTLTVRHSREDTLEDVWDAIQSGWHAITSGKRWKTVQQIAGITGWVKAVEVTWGDPRDDGNGWHVHVHAVIVLDDTSRVDYLRQYVGERWLAGIERTGFTALLDVAGLNITISNGDAGNLGKYLAKMGAGGIDADVPETYDAASGLAREATLGQSKSARLGGMSPFQLGAAAVSTGDAYLLKHWALWVKGSRRRRALTWSKGLREWASLDAEQTDEEVAAEAPGGDVLVCLPRDSYAYLQRNHMLCDLLDLVDEREGSLAFVTTWLDSYGIAWRLPDDRPERDHFTDEQPATAAPPTPPRREDAGWSVGWHHQTLDDVGATA